jgi:hypothetical protein
MLEIAQWLRGPRKHWRTKGSFSAGKLLALWFASEAFGGILLLAFFVPFSAER